MLPYSSITDDCPSIWISDFFVAPAILFTFTHFVVKKLVIVKCQCCNNAVKTPLLLLWRSPSYFPSFPYLAYNLAPPPEVTQEAGSPGSLLSEQTWLPTWWRPHPFIFGLCTMWVCLVWWSHGERIVFLIMVLMFKECLSLISLVEDFKFKLIFRLSLETIPNSSHLT